MSQSSGICCVANEGVLLLMLRFLSNQLALLIKCLVTYRLSYWLSVLRPSIQWVKYFLFFQIFLFFFGYLHPSNMKILGTFSSEVQLNKSTILSVERYSCTLFSSLDIQNRVFWDASPACPITIIIIPPTFPVANNSSWRNSTNFSHTIWKSIISLVYEQLCFN